MLKGNALAILILNATTQLNFCAFFDRFFSFFFPRHTNCIIIFRAVCAITWSLFEHLVFIFCGLGYPHCVSVENAFDLATSDRGCTLGSFLCPIRKRGLRRAHAG